MLSVTSFRSLNGETWVLSEGLGVIAYFKSRDEARRERVRLYLAKRARRPARRESPP
jgi:hypothetical protein